MSKKSRRRNTSMVERNVEKFANGTALFEISNECRLRWSGRYSRTGVRV